MRDVVHLQRQDGIATVVMEDRESKNTFSKELTSGLLKTFDEIQKDKTVKAVVLRGFENYFCCGGTREELLKIYSGEAVFTDGHIHDLLLRCEVPVISAMQGHALGGGLALGSYADILVMGTQCLYSTNFMKYGFTPGFGSTFIIPKRFGDTLGREMLFTARNYHGAELKERGAGAIIVDKNEVVSTAMKLARELVEKPRLALVTLKKHFSSAIEADLTECIRKELRMHELTFSQPEVRERIETLFGNA
ncbi:enoyl-CoA hydratase/isomerase family protein [Archangium violaceum]|jgi:polyketide biosynthesis enoyl-CoA hydratase PksI|uniref:polyketide synthase n=1 Tax=Archangium violaceum TaxID=83451 RepID=UPI00194F8543|nr:polyketide synthase [Archangium violaceum]QRN93156.1 enoyl-CoA hydratase/isomerase family protein [Archangium violaceum]UQK84956.1 hypothetical protein [Archangium gephyra]